MPWAGVLLSEAWLPVMCRLWTLEALQRLLELRLDICYTHDIEREFNITRKKIEVGKHHVYCPRDKKKSNLFPWLRFL